LTGRTPDDENERRVYRGFKNGGGESGLKTARGPAAFYFPSIFRMRRRLRP
jgi:hypothetical protein